MGASLPSTEHSSSRPYDAALHDDLAVVLRGQREGGLEFRGVVRLGDADGRAEIGGLDEHGKGQAAAGFHDAGQSRVTVT